MSGKRGPVLLAVLDGWGERAEKKWNAIRSAPARHMEELQQKYPSTLLSASGRDVGLPHGLMGNSEVGHLNIGAGRVVWQPITRIDKSIEDGVFFETPAFLEAIEFARKKNGAVHLCGLISDGGVHSSDRHYLALLELCAKKKFPAEKVFFHALLDGRDTPPRSAKGYIAAIEEKMRTLKLGRIASVCGRYFAMDRDKRWDRTGRAHTLLTQGVGENAKTALEAVDAGYARAENDEFIQPTVIGGASEGRMRDGDALILFNFRPDRMRQITWSFIAKEFSEFTRASRLDFAVASMTQYQDSFEVRVAFPPQYLQKSFGEMVSQAGLRQLRIAETEKYAHVTYFFNGGEEQSFPGEDRILIPSPKVATYDLKPEMSAPEVTSTLLQKIDSDSHDFYLINYANPDMVGHTGVWDASLAAVKITDDCVKQLSDLILKKGGMMAITADHGNCELMWNEETNQAHTAHTTNPVPFILISEEHRKRSLQKNGKLGDVAPSLLAAMGLVSPEEMTGRSLLGN